MNCTACKPLCPASKQEAGTAVIICSKRRTVQRRQPRPHHHCELGSGRGSVQKAGAQAGWPGAWAQPAWRSAQPRRPFCRRLLLHWLSTHGAAARWRRWRRLRKCHSNFTAITAICCSACGDAPSHRSKSRQTAKSLVTARTQGPQRSSASGERSAGGGGSSRPRQRPWRPG